jgi:hypothetical protein
VTPAGAALGVFPLAKEFGWPVSYILWDLPLAWFYQAHTWLMWSRKVRLRRAWRPPVDRADIARELGI